MGMGVRLRTLNLYDKIFPKAIFGMLLREGTRKSGSFGAGPKHLNEWPSESRFESLCLMRGTPSFREMPDAQKASQTHTVCHAGNIRFPGIFLPKRDCFHLFNILGRESFSN